MAIFLHGLFMKDDCRFDPAYSEIHRSVDKKHLPVFGQRPARIIDLILQRIHRPADPFQSGKDFMRFTANGAFQLISGDSKLIEQQAKPVCRRHQSIHPVSSTALLRLIQSRAKPIEFIHRHRIDHAVGDL